MKMDDALRIMKDEPQPAGFMVHFERVEGALLHSDYFPDVHAGENPIPTEEEAWALATMFAAKTYGRCINIYVIRRENFAPVSRYQERMIGNRDTKLGGAG